MAISSASVSVWGTRENTSGVFDCYEPIRWLYTQRRQKLSFEEAQLHEEKAERAGIADKVAEMRTLAELAKNLNLSYQFGDYAEKRQVVEIAMSNRLVKGRNVSLCFLINQPVDQRIGQSFTALPHTGQSQ